VPSNARFGRSISTTATALIVGLLVAIAMAACVNGSKPVLTQQAEAHRLASHLRVEFTRAADASNRAVMADTDEASTKAAHEAQQATESVRRDSDGLHRVLDELGDRTEAGQLDAFKARFDEYEKLDQTILPLAVENTNIKAQRLSFGPGQEAVNAFRQAIEAAAGGSAASNPAAAAMASRVTAALLEVQVLEARHIAESDEGAMTRMEASMATAFKTASEGLDALKKLRLPIEAAQLAAAAAALERFSAVNAEIVTLSRRNSNVRSLALSLGRKRAVTAQCEDILQQLEDTLAQHHFSATR
jgi:hypothetical protein